MSIKREQKLYDALKRIASYDSLTKIARTSKRNYGLQPSEVVEMAYENVIFEAKSAIKGMKRPTDRAALSVSEGAKP